MEFRLRMPRQQLRAAEPIRVLELRWKLGYCGLESELDLRNRGMGELNLSG